MEDDSNYMFRPIAAIIRYSSESMVVVLYTIVVVMSRWWDLIICDICYCKEMWGGGWVGFRDEARGLQQAVASPWLHQKCPWCFFPWPQYSASTIMRLRFGLSLDIGRFLPVGKTVGLWIHLHLVPKSYLSLPCVISRRGQRELDLFVPKYSCVLLFFN